MLRISDVKDVNKRKYRLTPVKLESKKHNKKMTSGRVLVGRFHQTIGRSLVQLTIRLGGWRGFLVPLHAYGAFAA